MTSENLLNADVPEKFKDAETGAVKMDALVQSYRELEKKLSQSPRVPKSHDEYCVDCSHGLFVPDEAINKRLHAKGFTAEQVQEVYDLAAEKMMPMMMEIAAEYRADREVEKLIQHFGGADKWREMSRQLLGFGQKNLPADVLENLAGSYEGVLALHRMMKGEEPRMNQEHKAMPEAVDDGDLRSMMRDPKYWREKDPAFIAKVTQGFQDLYGSTK
jgi:hypothetical protein